MISVKIGQNETKRRNYANVWCKLSISSSLGDHFLNNLLLIIYYLFLRYWDLTTKIIVNKFRTDSQCNQSGARTALLVKNTVRPISNADDEISLTINERTEENVIRELLLKNPHALKTGLFAQLKNWYYNKKTKIPIKKKPRCEIARVTFVIKTKDKDMKLDCRWHPVQANFALKFNTPFHAG